MANNNNPLSAAIIGTGLIAGGYDQNRFPGGTGVYTHAGAYEKFGKIKLKTVCDINPDKAADFKTHWKAETWTADLNTIYSTFHDIISVCTPDETHCEITDALINNRCCKTIFVEKPIASTLHDIETVTDKARMADMYIVVNYQRSFDPSHLDLKEKIQKDPGRLRTVNAYYIKGLSHIGTTMIQTLTSICGYPHKVMSYNRVWNREVKAYSYEFILFYEEFNITVKTVDSTLSGYAYHIFEIDLLFSDERIVINDNSRQIEKKEITSYAYGDVTVLNDRSPVIGKTGYETSMIKAVAYLYEITRGQKSHTVNTPENSYNNTIIADHIVKSFTNNHQIETMDEKWIS
jgi:predicted dehydrogenase